MAASILTMCIAYLTIVIEAGPCPETQHCSDCDNTTGHCLTECDTGHFGQMCSLVCSENCKNKNCILVRGGIGNCTEGCVSGYQGRGCNIPCDNPGGNCTACPGGCDGEYCQLGSFCVSGCVDSNYGTDCDDKSAGPCQENQHCSDCDSTTGHCLTECDTGYFGRMCSSVCSENCKNKSCILVGGGIGNCTEGCVPGYHGRGCNIPCDSIGGTCTACSGVCNGGYCQLGSSCFSECEDSYYGSGCKNCSSGCTPCNRKTGTCDEESGTHDMYVRIGLVVSALFLIVCIFVTIYTSFKYLKEKREERHQEDEDIYLPNVPAEERVAPNAFRHSNARYSEVNDNDMGTVVVFL